jgi:flagellar hook-length control protein FliK
MQAAAASESAAVTPPLPVASAPAPASVAIDTPVHHPQFADEAAERIVSLVTRGVERAELKLSPAELGPVEVRIDLRGGEASLAIVATQPATRDALEQALPLLRELLAQQGLALGEASVRDGRADGEPASRDAFSPTGDARNDSRDEASAMVAHMRAGPRRLVDVFA